MNLPIARRKRRRLDYRLMLPLRKLRTEHERAATEALEHPPMKEKEESWKVIPEFTGPKGEPIEVEQNSAGRLRSGGQVEALKPIETPLRRRTPQQDTYDSLIKTRS